MKLLSNLKCKVFFLAVLCSNDLFGQYKLEQINELAKKYGSEKLVVLNWDIDVKIRMVKGKPQTVKKISYDYLILDKAFAEFLSDESIEFSSFEKITDIKAYSINLDNDKAVKQKVDEFSTRDAPRGGSTFHDDTKQIQFFYKGLGKNSIRHLSYVETSFDEHFPDMNFVSPSSYTVKTRLNVQIDPAIKVSVFKYFMDDTRLKYVETATKKGLNYTWSGEELKDTKSSDGEPSVMYFKPHVILQIASYTSKKGTVDVISSLSSLHKWQYEFIKDAVEKPVDKALAEKAVELTKDISTDYNKVKAIYYWVQDNIKYVAFEDGIGGFKPRACDVVFTKRYGDCKDMANLIYAMLKSVNITSHLTWIGTVDKPYKYSELPSMTVANHMINLCKVDGKYLYLDATNNYQDIRFPTQGIQGKEGMLHHDKDNSFTIETIPVITAAQTYWRDSAVFSIQGTSLIGKASTLSTGYYKDVGVSRITYSEAKDTIDKVKSLYRRGNNTFKITKASTVGIGNRDASLTVNYEFEIKNFVNVIDKEIFLKLAMDEVMIGPEMEKDRVSPYEIPYHNTNDWIYELNIPDGYKVKFLPEAVNIKNDIAGYQMSYSQQKGKVLLNIKTEIKTMMVYPKDFTNWNEYIAAMRKSMSKSIVLEKI
jgi:Transglutaminase-like superfamily/Domain of Unknown Function with PDB structure (DUF3857)